MGELRVSEAFPSKDPQRGTGPAHDSLPGQRGTAVGDQQRAPRAKVTAAAGKYCSGMWDSPATWVKVCRPSGAIRAGSFR